MRYRLRIEVGLKLGHSDPEGETTARLLRELGYEVEPVIISKVYNTILKATSKKEARTWKWKSPKRVEAQIDR